MKRKLSHFGTTWLIAALFLCLILLTVVSIYLLQSSSSGTNNVPFDLEQITAQKSTDETDISTIILPAFIGITADGEGLGTSVSVNTVAELYGSILPLFAELLTDGYASAGSDTRWNEAIASQDHLYIRYHHEMPDYVLHTVAGGSLSKTCAAYVYELCLIPYSDSTDSIVIVAKSLDGVITVYEKKSPSQILTAEDLSKIARSYRATLTSYTYSQGADAEPVFQSLVVTRNIIVTSGSSLLLHTSDSGLKTVLRLFNLNPDKLLSKNISTSGTGSCADQKGIFYIQNSSFEYRAAQEGGVSLEQYVRTEDTPTLADYLRASLAIYEGIASVNTHFTGGDADIILASVSSENGTVTFTFDYTFDNLHITDIEPALSITFQDGLLTHALLNTLSVQNLGVRSESIEEWWFLDHLRERSVPTPLNCTLVYKADFTASSIRAQWRGEGRSEEAES